MNKFDSFLINAKLLKKHFNIVSLLYGSLGLKVLTNENINVDDIDILIPNIYLTNKWYTFIKVLEDNGYTLIDEHEHTFIKDNIKYSYASIEELKDFANIDEIDIKEYEDYKLLNLHQYLKVYKASLKDSYRKNHKNKDDQSKIKLIERIIGEESEIR